MPAPFTIALLIFKNRVTGNQAFPRLAIEFFMRHTKARRLAGRLLPTEVRIGDTDETIADEKSDFCIQISSDSEEVAAYVKERFLPFAAAGIRTIERPAESLFVLLGGIQPDGRFVPNAAFASLCDELARQTNWRAADPDSAAIRFPCPSCGQTIKAIAGATGKKGRCPACQAIVVVPKNDIPASATMEVECRCGTTHSVGLERAGEPFQCPACGAVNRLPTLTEKAAVDARKCPACKALMSAAAVECEKCGQKRTPPPTVASVGDMPYASACFDSGFVEKEESCPWSQLPGAIDIVRAGNRQDWHETLRLAGLLVQSHGDHGFGYFWLAQAYRGTRQFDTARECLLTGIARASNKYSLCLKLGEVEWDRGGLDAAVRWWINSAVLQFRADNFREHAPFLYLSYVAEGGGQEAECSALRRVVDKMRSGQIRLNPDADAPLVDAGRRSQNQDVRNALTRLLQEFLQPAERAVQDALDELPSDRIPKCPNCGPPMRFVCREGVSYLFRCDGCGVDLHIYPS